MGWQFKWECRAHGIPTVIKYTLKGCPSYEVASSSPGYSVWGGKIFYILPPRPKVVYWRSHWWVTRPIR